MTVLFDDDVFDAQMKVEHAGHAFFDKETLAEFFGISRHSLSKWRQRGKIPPPHHYQEDHGDWDVPNPGLIRRAVWTNDQVVEMLLHD